MGKKKNQSREDLNSDNQPKKTSPVHFFTTLKTSKKQFWPQTNLGIYFFCLEPTFGEAAGKGRGKVQKKLLRATATNPAKPAPAPSSKTRRCRKPRAFKTCTRSFSRRKERVEKNFREVRDEGSMVRQCIQGEFWQNPKIFLSKAGCQVHRGNHMLHWRLADWIYKPSGYSFWCTRFTRDRMQHIPPMENASLQNISKVQNRRPKNLRQVQKFTQFTKECSVFLPYKVMLC